MLHAGFFPEFQTVIQSIASQPTLVDYGVAVTPDASANVYGTVVELLDGPTQVTTDCFGILINVNSNTTNGQQRDTMITLVRDQDGGTTWEDWIVDLLCADASTFGAAPAANGVNYYFPVYIRAGTSIGVKAKMNRASGTDFYVNVTLFGDPRFPEAVPIGQIVDGIGTTSASSSGTPITPSETAAEGAWTAIGSALSNSYWWLQIGIGCVDLDMGSSLMHVDIAVGPTDTDNKTIIKSFPVAHANAESFTWGPLIIGAACLVAAGDELWARAQASGSTSITAGQLSLSLYGVR